jgi:hypothetical protein
MACSETALVYLLCFRLLVSTFGCVCVDMIQELSVPYIVYYPESCISLSPIGKTSLCEGKRLNLCEWQLLLLSGLVLCRVTITPRFLSEATHYLGFLISFRISASKAVVIPTLD